MKHRLFVIVTSFILLAANVAVPGLTRPVQAQTMLCGWLEVPESTGVFDPRLTVYGTGQAYGFDQMTMEIMDQLMAIAPNLPGYYRLYDPVINGYGMIMRVSRFERVTSCEVLAIKPSTRTSTPTRVPTRVVTRTPMPVSIKPLTKVLPLHPDCIKQVSLTTSDLPRAWQSEVNTAGASWDRAGSKLRVKVTVIADKTRTIAALDFDGSPLRLVGGPNIRLARCEVRAIAALDLPQQNLDSIAMHLASLSQMGGWVQPYPDPANPKVALGYVLILNNVSFNWSIKSRVPLRGIDVQTIALHELGHALGVPHLADKQAVMSGDQWEHVAQWLGVRKIKLEKPDVNKLLSLYGKR